MASNFAREMIKRHEGIRLRPYKETTGHLTIGYGHNLESRGISQHVANEIFEEDLLDVEASMINVFGISIFQESEKRVAALLDMIFNLGENGFRRFFKMVQAVKDRDWEKAANEAEDSRWAAQVPTRAKEIIALLRGESHAVVK